MFLLKVVMLVSLTLTTAVHCTGLMHPVFQGEDFSPSQSNGKARRGGTVGLFHLPRVGRAQPERTWLLSPERLADLHEMKRQGLIPFPRVGRSPQDAVQGAGPVWRELNGDAGSGMWFGPRLGRFYKRAPSYANLAPPQYLEDSPCNRIALREGSPHNFTPRLGRESEEDAQDAQDSQDEQAERPALDLSQSQDGPAL